MIRNLLTKLRLRDEYGMSGLGMTLAIPASIVALFGTIAGIGFPLVNHSAHVSCLRLSEQTGLPTRFARSGLEGECYIQVDGKWIPENRWRAVDES